MCDSDIDYDVDQLISCDSCGITVHQSCYGVPELPGNDEVWQCRACELREQVGQWAVSSRGCTVDHTQHRLPSAVCLLSVEQSQLSKPAQSASRCWCLCVILVRCLLFRGTPVSVFPKLFLSIVLAGMMLQYLAAS